MFELEINYDMEIEMLGVRVVVVCDFLLNYSINYVEIYLLLDCVEKYQMKIYFFECSFVYDEEFEFDVGFFEFLEWILQCCLFSFDGFLCY